MGRKSKIETHHDSKTIITRLASGVEYSKIIEEFPDIRWQDLDYYAKNKLHEILSKSDELKSEVESLQGNDALAEVRALKSKALEILEDARGAGDLKTALLGIREVRGCLELIFKAEGRIQEQSINVRLQHINIYESPEWAAVGDLLLSVLAKEPYLKAKIAAGLLALARAKTKEMVKA